MGQTRLSLVVAHILCLLQTKTYHMVDEEEEMLQSAEGTDIQWEAGKNPTVKARPCSLCCAARSARCAENLSTETGDYEKSGKVGLAKAKLTWCDALMLRSFTGRSAERRIYCSCHFSVYLRSNLASFRVYDSDAAHRKIKGRMQVWFAKALQCNLQSSNVWQGLLCCRCLTAALPAQVMKKKAKAVKGKPAGRMLTKTEPCASFFNFFNPPAVPENPNDVDEDEMEELQQAMEEDYELGCALGTHQYTSWGALRPFVTCCGTHKCSRPWGSILSSGACWGGVRLSVTWCVATYFFSVVVFVLTSRSCSAGTTTTTTVPLHRKL